MEGKEGKCDRKMGKMIRYCKEKKKEKEKTKTKDENREAVTVNSNVNTSLHSCTLPSIKIIVYY